MSVTVTIVNSRKELEEARASSIADVIVHSIAVSAPPVVLCKRGHRHYVLLQDESLAEADLDHGISTVRLFMDDFIARISVGTFPDAGGIDMNRMDKATLEGLLCGLLPEDRAEVMVRLWRLTRDQDAYEIVPSPAQTETIGRRKLILS